MPRYRTPRSVLLVACVLCLLVLPSRPAYAYLDPGTGSMILQFLIAGIVGSLFVLKLCWQRVKAFFARHFSPRSKSGE